jgi:transposase
MLPTSVNLSSFLVFAGVSASTVGVLALMLLVVVPAAIFSRFFSGRNLNQTSTGDNMTTDQDPADEERELREKRRIKAWEMFQQGVSQAEIAKELTVTRGAVSQWIKAARDNGGSDALLSRPRPGRPNMLTDEQLAELKSMLQQTPADFGFSGQRWTYAKTAELIEKQFGVTYHPAHVSRLMKKIEQK